jgi:SAM-dependent methyltransferase
MFDDAHWSEVPAVAGGVLLLSRLETKTNPKILDLCCGFGRISAELARRGFSVTGVDITESYLQTAREDAAHEKLSIEYINADAREFSRPAFFDLALNLYISLGYFADPNDDLAMVRNVYESLKTGGCFIIETLGREIALRDFVKTDHFQRAGFTVLTEYELIEEESAQGGWTYLKNKWTLIKEGKSIEKTFIQRLYSGAQIRGLLKRAGFSAVELYGDWDESAYDEKAAKLIAVGRK